jgi:hypothetical protein
MASRPKNFLYSSVMEPLKKKLKPMQKVYSSVLAVMDLNVDPTAQML